MMAACDNRYNHDRICIFVQALHANYFLSVAELVKFGYVFVQFEEFLAKFENTTKNWDLKILKIHTKSFRNFNKDSGLELS